MARVRVPLFPLNTVLFPKMPLPLYVFEERFCKLIEHCVERKERFGVVLALDPEQRGADIARVGTFAQIHAVQKLAGGRYNVLALGFERFEVLGRERVDGDYEVALVETLEDEPADPEAIEPLVAEVRSLFDTFFQGLVQRAGLQELNYQLPEDPSDLSFVVAATVQASLRRRQELLEMTSIAERLQSEIALLEQGIQRLSEMPVADRVARPLDASKAKDELSRN